MRTLSRFAGLFATMMPGAMCVRCSTSCPHAPRKSSTTGSRPTTSEPSRSLRRRREVRDPACRRERPESRRDRMAFGHSAVCDHQRWHAGAAQPGRCAARGVPLLFARARRSAPQRPASGQFHASRRRPSRSHRLRGHGVDARRLPAGARTDGPTRLEERFDELTRLLYDNKFVLPGRTVTDEEIATTSGRSPTRSTPSRSTSPAHGCSGWRARPRTSRVRPSRRLGR